MKTQVQRTLLAPSQEKGNAWALWAWEQISKKQFKNDASLIQDFQQLETTLAEKLDAKVVLFYSKKPSFRREEYFSTGGVFVEIGHPSLPLPIGRCQSGYKTAWSCDRDGYFSYEEKTLCPMHYKKQLDLLVLYAKSTNTEATTEATVATVATTEYSRVYRPRRGRRSRRSH